MTVLCWFWSIYHVGFSPCSYFCDCFPWNEAVGSRGGHVSLLPVFQSAWVRWPLRSVWVWTGTCWVWTGSPAPAAAGWWRRCGASGTSPTDQTEGPLEEEQKSDQSLASWFDNLFLIWHWPINPHEFTWFLEEFLSLTHNNTSYFETSGHKRRFRS